MGEKKHNINLVFTLVLLGIFALSALSVAVLGAQVYGRTAEQMNNNFNTRTSLIYITEKIRQCPGKNIEIKDVDGSQALVLSQKVDGKNYESWIFSSNGKLREVMVPNGSKVKAVDGQEIMDIGSFDLELKGNLLEIIILNDNGDRDSVVISVKD